MAGSTWNAINSQVPYQLLGGSGSGPIPPHDHEPSQTFSFGRYVTIGGGLFNLTTYLGSAGMGSLLGVPAQMGVPVSITSGSVTEVEFFRDEYVVPPPPLGTPGLPFLRLVKTNFDGTATSFVDMPVSPTLPGVKVETLTLAAPFLITQTDYLSMSLSSHGNFIFPAVRFIVKEA